jgi:hypothetical protein
MTATDESRMMMGNYISDGAQVTGAGHSYENVASSGKARVHAGNSYGGKSIFDD